MVEESETPGQGPRMGESDFLAERRARRATESGETALLRRAEAAEATVKTLESHVASLQARLKDAEEEHHRAAALLEAERDHGAERESELRRVKQREYAEQQLRVEAEERLSELAREERERSQRTGQRVSAGGEPVIAELSQRIEALQRQLAEAEQAAAAERASLRRMQSELQARVAELERRAEEIQRGIVAERAARERAERELAGIREGHRRMEGLIGEIRALIGRLGTMLSGVMAQRQPPASPPPYSAPPPVQIPAPAPARALPVEDAAAAQRGLEMADALAAAVERLRARALSAPPLPLEHADPHPGPGRSPVPPLAEPETPPQAAKAPAPQPSGEGEPAPVPPVSQGETAAFPPVPPVSPGDAAVSAPPIPPPAGESAAGQALTAAGVEPRAAVVPTGANKHSQSLIGRIRNRRKQRRAASRGTGAS